MCLIIYSGNSKSNSLDCATVKPLSDLEAYPFHRVVLCAYHVVYLLNGLKCPKAPKAAGNFFMESLIDRVGKVITYNKGIIKNVITLKGQSHFCF